MAHNLSQKLLTKHCVDGDMDVGNPIGLHIDQTLCQDATGTLVMLILEAMELDTVKTAVSAQYVDHNLLQEDNKNPDDHLFLLSAAKRFGLHYSRPGNGISHPLHMQHFGKPGASLVGSDSHTCANGSLGMLAIGAGGADVALAMAGEAVYITMPSIWGVELTGKLPEWVSAKDIVLEMLRRFDVDGGRDCIIEYFGDGLNTLSAMDRHVIANMGAELGATTTVFPADKEVRRYLASEGRKGDWSEFIADKDCQYDRYTSINLHSLVPLIARPSSPGNVVPVEEVTGEPIHQSYIGSSANPGTRDFMMAAEIVRDQVLPQHVSFDINPATKQSLDALAGNDSLNTLLCAGARLHEIGCNGCIGMGQAPATDKNSLRTTPRNFPGRSGTREDKVWLCSPETAAASALKGAITDPRTLKRSYPHIQVPSMRKHGELLQLLQTNSHKLEKGPNIMTLPELEPITDTMSLIALLKLGDNISTDEILPAGAEVLPLRSNIPKISEYAFAYVDEDYVDRSRSIDGGHAIIAGENYGQGSSREHAALVLRYLGLRLVIAKSFARIHWQNLINFGVLPCTFVDNSDYETITTGDDINIDDVATQMQSGREITLTISENNKSLTVQHQLDDRQKQIIECGGVVPWVQRR